ncbi:hypothetical protein [Chlamydia sp. 17-3921]|nr:hypothetical protein [Chlamydia sp. 17-3921]
MSDSPHLIKAIGFTYAKQKMEFLGLVYYPDAKACFLLHTLSLQAASQE